MSRLPMKLSPTERRKHVALAASGGKSNRAIAIDLGVNEATVRRDRTYLETPAEQRPVKGPKKVRAVPQLNREELLGRRFREIYRLAQSWVAKAYLNQTDIDFVLNEAGKRLYMGKAFVARFPDRPEPPFEVLEFARPRRIPENDMAAKREYCADWLARWLAMCLPREEEVRDEVLRSLSQWAQGIT
jgi:transposase-like protein